MNIKPESHQDYLNIFKDITHHIKLGHLSIKKYNKNILYFDCAGLACGKCKLYSEPNQCKKPSEVTPEFKLTYPELFL